MAKVGSWVEGPLVNEAPGDKGAESLCELSIKAFAFGAAGDPT